jgi:hypothetical protein
MPRRSQQGGGIKATREHRAISASSAAAAARMRLHRKRQREGLALVPVTLRVTDIDRLVWMELLDPKQRQDKKALAAAVVALLEHDWRYT